MRLSSSAVRYYISRFALLARLKYKNARRSECFPGRRIKYGINLVATHERSQWGVVAASFSIAHRDVAELHGQHAPRGSWFLRPAHHIFRLFLWKAARHAHGCGELLPGRAGDVFQS